MTTTCALDTSKNDAHEFSKSFMYSIHQLYFLVQKHLEHALSQSHHISFSQFMILVGFQCSNSVHVSQSAIAEYLYLTEATVSRHISTLVDLGLLSRSEDETNRRKHVIRITSKGKKAFDDARNSINAELQTLFGVIKEKDRSAIMKNFNNVLTVLLAKK